MPKTRPSELTNADELANFLRSDYKRLVTAVWTVTRSREAAEELVQEALARGLDAMAKGRQIDHLAAYVRTTAFNLSRNRWRSISRERFALRRASHGSLPDNTDDSDAVAAAMAFQQAAMTLPRREREAMALVYYLDLSVEEAASRMNISEGTVKALLSRARRRLATTLDTTLEVVL